MIYRNGVQRDSSDLEVGSGGKRVGEFEGECEGTEFSVNIIGEAEVPSVDLGSGE